MRLAGGAGRLLGERHARRLDRPRLREGARQRAAARVGSGAAAVSRARAAFSRLAAQPGRRALEPSIDRRQHLEDAVPAAHPRGAVPGQHPDAAHLRPHLAEAAGPHPAAGAVAQLLGAVHRAGHAGRGQHALAAHPAVEEQPLDRRARPWPPAARPGRSRSGRTAGRAPPSPPRSAGRAPRNPARAGPRRAAAGTWLSPAVAERRPAPSASRPRVSTEARPSRHSARTAAPGKRRRQSIGTRPRSIASRRSSRNGGSDSRCPSVSNGSSTAKPGPSVAISNRLPPGSRK